MFGNPETTTGGRALKFYASVRVDIRRIGSRTEVVVGGRTRVKVVKKQDGAALPGGRVRHPVWRGYLAGGDVLDLAVDRKIVEKKSGTWFSFSGERHAPGREEQNSSEGKSRHVSDSRDACSQELGLTKDARSPGCNRDARGRRSPQTASDGGLADRGCPPKYVGELLIRDTRWSPHVILTVWRATPLVPR